MNLHIKDRLDTSTDTVYLMVSKTNTNATKSSAFMVTFENGVFKNSDKMCDIGAGLQLSKKDISKLAENLNSLKKYDDID